MSSILIASPVTPDRLDQLPIHSFLPGQDSKHPAHWSGRNPFVFRVWGEGLDIDGDTIVLNQQDGFVSHGFKQWTGDVLRRKINARLEHSSKLWDKEIILRHIDRRNHPEYSTLTPYVSASFSLMWAIWNALHWIESEKSGVSGEEVHISAIRIAYFDGTPDTLAVASAFLDKTSKEQAAWAFSTRSQELLVYGRIPSEAVVSTVTLQDLRRSLPRWISELSILPKVVDHSRRTRSACARKYAVEWARRMREVESTRTGAGAKLALKLALEVLEEPTSVSHGSRMSSEIIEMSVYIFEWAYRQDPDSSTYQQSDRLISGSTTKDMILEAWSSFGGQPATSTSDAGDPDSLTELDEDEDLTLLFPAKSQISRY